MLFVLMIGCNGDPGLDETPGTTSPSTADTAPTDSGTTTSCETVFEGDSETRSLDAVLATSTADDPVRIELDEPGTLTLCPGTTWASLVVHADEFVLRGPGKGMATLSGGGVNSVLIVTESYADVLVEGVTLADGYNCGGSLIGIHDALDPEVCGPYTIYPGVDLTLRDVTLSGAGSRLPTEAEAIKIGNDATLTLERSEVLGSTGRGIHGGSSTVICTDSAIHSHGSNGVFFFVSGEAEVRGTGCDFGVGDTANGAPDVRLFNPTSKGVTQDFEGVVDFVCTFTGGCTGG